MRHLLILASLLLIPAQALAADGCKELIEASVLMKGEQPIQYALPSIPVRKNVIYQAPNGRRHFVFNNMWNGQWRRKVWLAFVDGQRVYMRAGEFWYPSTLFEVGMDKFAVTYSAFDGKHIQHEIPGELKSAIKSTDEPFVVRHNHFHWKMNAEQSAIQGYFRLAGSVTDLPACLSTAS